MCSYANHIHQLDYAMTRANPVYIYYNCVLLRACVLPSVGPRIGGFDMSEISIYRYIELSTSMYRIENPFCSPPPATPVFF